jgi:predicted aminopeptidase
MKWRIAMLCVATAMVASCTQLGYFVQAAQGQYAVLADAKPIDDWLNDPATEAALKDRLEKVRQIRAFAAQELGLPDNGSFKTYTDLKRPFVLWNVVATPELSLKPEQWCFPIAGCVTYRGYYSKEDAQRYAVELRHKGFDVQVGGVPAYSTLGWFNDPVLSSFIQYPDVRLARLVFHELAHQVVYVPGDTQFNESFATAVEEAGVARWMEKYGDDNMRERHAAIKMRQQDFLDLLLKHRALLDANYQSDDSAARKRQRKKEIFESLVNEYAALKVKWGGYSGYDRWFAEPLSNAHLASVAAYHDHVPAFQALLEQHQTMPGFYQAVRELAGLDRDARNERLAQLGSPPQLAQRPEQSMDDAHDHAH